MKRGRTFRRRRFRAAFTVGLGVIAVWLAVSLGSALTNPTYGSSLSARFAEWARQHGGASVVDWTENEWYSHHPPKVGGKPPAGAIKTPAVAPKVAATSGPAHLTPPAPIEPFVSPAIPGEGQWSPAGRSVGGIPAVYTTTHRPDTVHTS